MLKSKTTFHEFANTKPAATINKCLLFGACEAGNRSVSLEVGSFLILNGSLLDDLKKPELGW